MRRRDFIWSSTILSISGCLGNNQSDEDNTPKNISEAHKYIIKTDDKNTDIHWTNEVVVRVSNKGDSLRNPNITITPKNSGSNGFSTSPALSAGEYIDIAIKTQDKYRARVETQEDAATTNINKEMFVEESQSPLIAAFNIVEAGEIKSFIGSPL